MAREDFALFNYCITFPSRLVSGFCFDNKLIKDFCENLGSFYAFVLHDRDKTEYIHYHIVIVLKVKCKKSTLMELFKTFFSLETLDSIEFERCTSVVSSLRYLIHYDDLDKFQYTPLDIVTNNDYRFHSALLYTEDLDIDFLVTIVKKYRSACGVMRVIGLEKYKKYRNVIKDLLDEIFIL